MHDIFRTEDPCIVDSLAFVFLENKRATDVYLWVCNRVLNRQPLSPELRDFGVWLLKQSSFDGIGMDTLRMRWKQFERELPAIHEMDSDQVRFAVKTREEHRERVKAMNIGG